jgi:hypothetical protein
MTTAPHDDGPSQSPTEAILASRDDFQRALLAGLSEADDAGSALLWFSDADFAAWPLGQPALIDALTRWVGARRRLVLLAADYEGLASRHPRWHRWRRHWSHAVECRRVAEELAATVPTMLLVPQRVAVRLHDPRRHRGRVLRAEADLAACAQQLDALSQRSEGALPVTTLGL